jgi:hypothetical protein
MAERLEHRHRLFRALLRLLYAFLPFYDPAGYRTLDESNSADRD